jgi:hypothetical protein
MSSPSVPDAPPPVTLAAGQASLARILAVLLGLQVACLVPAVLLAVWYVAIALFVPIWTTFGHYLGFIGLTVGVTAGLALLLGGGAVASRALWRHGHHSTGLRPNERAAMFVVLVGDGLGVLVAGGLILWGTDRNADTLTLLAATLVLLLGTCVGLLITFRTSSHA